MTKPLPIKINRSVILGLTILISSCSDRVENAGNLTEATKIINSVVRKGDSDTLKTDEIPADSIIPFHGIWATEKYINTLIKTRSPNQSQGDGEFFQIPRSYNDKAFPFVYHEGAADFHVIKHNDLYYIKAYNNSDNDDSTQIVFIENGNKMKIWNKLFVKGSENVGFPEDLLFKGEYFLGSRTVVFNSNGTINGLDDIHFYSIENDYFGPGMDDLDIIYLGKTKEQHLTNCFKFQADTLFIYDIKCLEEDEYGNCLDLRKADLKYKLIKKDNSK